MTDYTNLKARLEDRMVCSIAQNSCRNDWMCEQALAAIEELEARNQWQPIETAPKDGSEFDVWINWRGRVADVILENGVFRELAIDDFDGMSWCKLHGNPTHWMPRPQPPETDNDHA